MNQGSPGCSSQNGVYLQVWHKLNDLSIGRVPFSNATGTNSDCGSALGVGWAVHIRMDHLQPCPLDCTGYRKCCLRRRVRCLNHPAWPLSCHPFRSMLQWMGRNGLVAGIGGTPADVTIVTHHRTILVYSGVFTFLVDAYPVYAASALAANSFTRSTFAAIFPLFGIQSQSFFYFVFAYLVPCQPTYPFVLCFGLHRQMDVFRGVVDANIGLPHTVYHRLGYNWATCLLAFLTVAMAPFP